MLGLLVALALTQTPQHRLFRQPNLPRSSLAFFEFAPQSGTGMGTACACTTPTGAKGEALTFTRASSGTCLKGNTTTGIANGDMVTCSSNQPRVMPGGDGSGALGLLVEGARTNSCLQSQEVGNNAAWVESHSGGSAITVTANAAVAPDGTTTAERFQIGARSSGWALYQQAAVGGATAHSASVFVKGNGQSGSFHLTIDNAAGCKLCTYVDGQWSRCLNENVSRPAAVVLSVGIDVTDCGGSFAAQDFFIWGADDEAGAYATSYIATAGATATRASDVPSFPAVAGLNTAGSVAATVTATTVNGTHGILSSGTSGGLLYALPTPTVAIYDGTTETTLATTWSTQPHRYASSWSGSTQTVFDVTAGTSTSGSFDGTMSATNFCIGSGAGGLSCSGGQLDGVIKQVCADPQPGRCR